MGFAVATHYCGGMAVESKLVFGDHNLDCGMADMDQKPCTTDPSTLPEIKKKPCCENEYQSLDVEDDYKPSIVYSGISLDFVVAFTYAFFDWTGPSQSLSSQYANYYPPPIEQDIAVLYQVFRI